MEKATPVVPDSVSHTSNPWYQKKNVLIDGAVIIAVAIIIGVIWWVGRHPQNDQTSSVPQFSGQALVDEVNKKYGLNDYAGAISLIKGQKSINDTSTQLLLANAYANQGNKASALKVYEKLYQAGKLTDSSLAAAAVLAEESGDNAKALEYYRAAVSKLKAEANPAVGDYLPVYESKVDELSKKVTQ